VGLSSVKEMGADTTDKAKTKGDSLPAETDLTPPLASPKADTSAVQPIAGAIFRAALDRSHWLTAGYGAVSSRHGVRRTFLTPSTTGQPRGVRGGTALLSGFAWPTRAPHRAHHLGGGRAAGRGHVVIFAQTRCSGVLAGDGRLVTNAMLFGTGR